jgi:hypothetical protein
MSSAHGTSRETTDLHVEIANRTRDGLPMVVAVVGVPGGLKTRSDQLQELVKSGAVDFVETRVGT